MAEYTYQGLKTEYEERVNALDKYHPSINSKGREKFRAAKKGVNKQLGKVSRVLGKLDGIEGLQSEISKRISFEQDEKEASSTAMNLSQKGKNLVSKLEKREEKLYKKLDKERKKLSRKLGKATKIMSAVPNTLQYEYTKNQYNAIKGKITGLSEASLTGRNHKVNAKYIVEDKIDIERSRQGKIDELNNKKNAALDRSYDANFNASHLGNKKMSDIVRENIDKVLKNINSVDEEKMEKAVDQLIESSKLKLSFDLAADLENISTAYEDGPTRRIAKQAKSMGVVAKAAKDKEKARKDKAAAAIDRAKKIFSEGYEYADKCNAKMMSYVDSAQEMDYLIKNGEERIYKDAEKTVKKIENKKKTQGVISNADYEELYHNKALTDPVFGKKRRNSILEHLSNKTYKDIADAEAIDAYVSVEDSIKNKEKDSPDVDAQTQE